MFPEPIQNIILIDLDRVDMEKVSFVGELRMMGNIMKITGYLPQRVM